MEQYNQHEKYYVHKVSDDLWWVFRRVGKVVVNGLPNPSDVAVRWHRKYGYYYARDGYDEVTKAFNVLMLAALPGPKLKPETRDKTWAIDDAVIEEMRAVVDADFPVLVGHWAGTEASSVKTKSSPDDGVYVKSCERLV